MMEFRQEITKLALNKYLTVLSRRRCAKTVTWNDEWKYFFSHFFRKGEWGRGGGIFLFFLSFYFPRNTFTVRLMIADCCWSGGTCRRLIRCRGEWHTWGMRVLGRGVF